MRIKQMSDLHLEFDPDFFPANTTESDTLLLNGDIYVASYFLRGQSSPYYNRAQRVLNWFERASREYKNVIYVPGNHEYYSGYIDTTDDLLNGVLIDLPNVHLLQNESILLDDVLFIGGTLWTDCNNNDPLAENHLKYYLNDFNIVQWGTDYRKFSPFDSTVLHKATKEFIFSEARKHNKVVVATHHAPSEQSIHESYRDPMYKYGNYGYFSNLEQQIIETPQIKLWTHGHVHNNFDYMVGDTRVVCNPKGYRDENPTFNPYNMIEV